MRIPSEKIQHALVIAPFIHRVVQDDDALSFLETISVGFLSET